MHIDPPHAPGISRRDFLRTGALSATVLPAVAALPAQAAQAKSATSSFAPSTDLLETARSTAQWIDSVRREDAQGVWWLPDPDHPEHETTVSAKNAFYSGSAGTVLFFLQLAEATGDASYREAARRGASYLAATWSNLAKPADGKAADLTIYNGLSGSAFALHEAARATGDAQLLQASRDATDVIAAAAQPAGAGLAWTGVPGVASDGSVVLYLLHAATASKGNYRAILLPDNPFPPQRSA